MFPVIYDVAVSIDGFIAGPGGTVSDFPHSGPMVDAYLERLGQYRAAIMGRASYEVGLAYGLAPGEAPYPGMAETLVFSSTLTLPEGAPVRATRAAPEEEIARLRQTAGGPIYLVGGGHFAASLAARCLIDRLRLKRAPILLGGGTPLFAGAVPQIGALVQQCDFGAGQVFQDYALTALGAASP